MALPLVSACGSMSICMYLCQCKSARLTRVHIQYFEKMADEIRENSGGWPCGVMVLMSMELVVNGFDVRWWRANGTANCATIACTWLRYRALQWDEWGCTCVRVLVICMTLAAVTTYLVLTITNHYHRLYLRKLAPEFPPPYKSTRQIWQPT